MKSMVRLFEALFLECFSMAGIDASRDLTTVRRRLVSEGDSFLTITLPNFEADLMSAIEAGRILPTHFSRWKRDKFGKRPLFCGALVGVIFTDDGSLRTDNIKDHGEVIYLLRQILLFTKKVEREPTPKRVKDAIEQYKRTDREIPELPDERLLALQATADHLFGDLLACVEADFFEKYPSRHSSGALATRESYNSRFESRVWTDRLQRVIPFWDYLDVNWRHSVERPVQMLSHSEEPGCRVFTVPKTMKGPRIIAMEPVYNNLVQQGVLRTIDSVLQSRQFKDIKNIIDWHDQSRNQRLAREGSVTKSLCTIDLSEASDRVSLPIVRDSLLGSHRYLRDISMASRSEYAELPGEERIPLRKFASMGSALTFPYETMVFTSICFQAMKRVTPSLTISNLVGRFSVYGDDIIVPTRYMSVVIEELEAYGLKINPRKSFGNSFFRESCGEDWYYGRRVNPVRLSTDLPDNSHHGPELIVKAVDLHNRLYKAGMWESARVVRENVLPYQYVPYSPIGSVGVSFHTYELERVRWKFDKNLHTHSYRTLIPKNKKPSDPLDGWGALRKFFLMRGIEPLDREHFSRDRKSVV